MNSLHNHSKWSDGQDTLRDMALAAKAAGVSEFGISDHFVIPPPEVDAKDVWWVKPSLLGEYFDEATALKNELSDSSFKMYVGVEVDFFPETIDCVRETLALYNFDYVIGAAHFAGAFPIDLSADDWEPLSEEQRAEVWRIYLERLCGLCQSKCFDWVAHIDLPKKFGYAMPDELYPKMVEVVRTVAASDMAIELNTAGMDKPCREFYPAEWLLDMAVEQAIPVALTADAHSVSQITRHFRSGMIALARSGTEPASVNRLFGRRRD